MKLIFIYESKWSFQSIAIKTLDLLLLCLHKWRNKISNAEKLCLLIKELGLGILIRKNRATTTRLPWLALSCKLLVQLTKHLNFCIKQFWFNCAVLADLCCPLGDVWQSAIIGRDLRSTKLWFCSKSTTSRSCFPQSWEFTSTYKQSEKGKKKAFSESASRVSVQINQ